VPQALLCFFLVNLGQKNTFFQTKCRCLTKSLGNLLVGIDQFGLAGERIKKKYIGTHFATGRAAAATVAVNNDGVHWWVRGRNSAAAP